MLYLKFAGQLAAVLIAVIALFGDTSNKNKLTELGRALLFLIVIAGAFNLIVLVFEENEKAKKEIDLVSAKNTIYYRLIRDIEAAKHVFLWKDYNILDEPTESLDYENAPSVFMHPSESDLAERERKILVEMEDFLRSMSLAYENNREYLSFEEADSLSRFIQTMKTMKVYSILSEYDEKHGEFADYLISNDLHHTRLKHLFLSLYALEIDIKGAKEKNQEKFYELRPECEDPDDIEIMFSCN